MRPEEALAGLLIACWGWRIWSLIYSSYSIADVLTFKSSSVTPRVVVTGTLIIVSLFFHIVPPSEFPLFSLINKVLSIPSEMYTLYFAHRYVSPALNSRRFTALLYFLTILSVIVPAVPAVPARPAGPSGASDATMSCRAYEYERITVANSGFVTNLDVSLLCANNIWFEYRYYY
ncbi:hypothetical protein RR46_06792 [Papilio xuthus]|uniref:Uncharacterized protein n=1 Tax=Papilio xuthus TaxID=66420 RepID=A0A194PSW8_PAPXU|nr:hypothetical protein RR46_06792 [Papilio xuthus]